MRRALILSILLQMPLMAHAGDRSPKLEAQALVHQFGSVDEGTIVEARFPITNTGTGLLEIKRIVASCGCTAAELEKKALQPGESTELIARFDTRGFFGPKTKTVRLYTNESKNSSVLFTLHGEVLREVAVDPVRVSFGDVLLGQTPESVIFLKPRKAGLQFGEPSSRSQSLDVSRDGETRIKVRIRENAAEGILRTTVLVPVKGEKESVVSIPVFARIQGELQLSPTSLSFGLLEGPLAGAVSKRVQLKNVGATPVKLIGVESDHPALQGEIRELKPGREFEVKVSLQQGATGVVNAQLTIQTDRADKKNVVLPVSAVLAERSE